MASLLISAAGAAIGNAIGGTFLGMSAASIGWSIGSLAGSMLFPTKAPTTTQEGPRLGDLRVSSATYGNPIPRVYGTFRIAGNMIWSTPIIETRHVNRVSSGGKGGGGKKVKQISYTYSQSLAVALCEGPISGVRKIWANGTLIYNLSDAASVETILASNAAAANIYVYPGSETQTANSLIQASVGAVNTPAYRGTAYVVFESLQLEKFGNRTPNLEFEVVDSIGKSIVAGTVTPEFVFDIAGVAGFVPFSTLAINASGTSYYMMTNARVSDLGVTIYVAPGAVTNRWAMYRWTDTLGKSQKSDVVYVDSSINPAGPGSWTTGGYQPWDREGYAVAFADILYVVDFSNRTETIINFPGLVYSYTSTRHGNHLYVGAYVTGVSGNVSTWYADLSSPAPQLTMLALGRLAIGSDAAGWHIWTGAAVVSYEHGTTTSYRSITTTATPHSGFARINDGFLYEERNLLKFLSDAGVTSTVGTISDQHASSWIYGAYGRGAWVSPYADGNWNILNKWFAVGVSAASTATVSAIVADVCDSVGLAGGDIDVTDLAASVTGYAITIGTARSHLQQLMQSYYFDAVESDGKIKFVTRGGASAATISEDDLAAHDYGGSPPDVLEISRAQDMELPVEFAVSFPNASAGYQVSTQTARRLTTDSMNKVSQSLAVVMTPAKGKEIADVLLYDAWAGRTTLDFVTSWKYAWLEPTDVITLTGNGRSYTVRLVSEDVAGGLHRRTAVMEDASVYTQTATAADSVAVDESVDVVTPTNLELLDIPLLRSQDDGIGFYAAAAGFGTSTSWPGAQLFKSSDGGTTWVESGDGFLNPATIGAATTALGDFSQNIFDEHGSVTITLDSGDLSSDTEANVLNGANAAVLGDELIQFRTATLISADTYTLTGLLRGRMGTEWARSTHAVGDRFILLETDTIYLLPSDTSEVDLERTYRAVTFDGYLDDTDSESFTNTAVSLVPYAPVHLGGGRNAALDITLNWTRRTRINGGWNSYADVPLGEDSQAYEVEIYTASDYATVARTITGLTSATTSYTAAQQTTDFGGTQATVYFIVYQVSATVGRGYEAKGVV